MGQLSEVHEKLLLLRLGVRVLLADARRYPRPLSLTERHSAGSRELKVATHNLWVALDRLHGKANFDPNQPRVPRGNPDGGQWTDVSGAGGGGRLQTGRSSSEAPPPTSGDQPPLRVTIEARSPTDKPIDVGQLGDPEEGIPPALRDEPKIPVKEPATKKDRNAVAKSIARWGSALLRFDPRVRITVTVGNWLYRELSPLIYAYWDEPKSLEQLQLNARGSRRGYDIHHIVEETAARNAGYPEEWINGPDNLVSIPRLKHWEITAFYMTKNENFDGLSPREWLQDKDWETRMRVGHEVLVKYGVLLP